MRRPYEFLREPMRLWYAQMLSHAPTTPAPRTEPTARAGSGTADRVLLFGNGPLHGWGVLTHGLSVVGHLADDLRFRTGRPVQVDYVGDERMTAASARAWLGCRAREDYDVIAVAVGMNDALRLEPVAAWAQALRGLLDSILMSIAPAARVVLVELPDIRSYQMAAGPLGRVAQHHAHRLNAVLHHLAAELPGIEVVPAPVERFEPDRPLGSSSAYQQWAHQLGARLAPALDAVRALRPPAPAPADLAYDWSGTEQALQQARSHTGNLALTEVTRRARERFGVALAAVNLLDHDRVWFAAHSGGAPSSIPRELAYCATTVEQDVPLVVPDSALDERFKDNAFIDVVGLPFYTGVPLRSRSGEAIGTFCLLDSEPHDASFVSITDLQPLVEEAQALLHDME